MTTRTLLVALSLATSFVLPVVAHAQSGDPTPAPSQDPSGIMQNPPAGANPPAPTPTPATTRREGWYRAGSAPRNEQQQQTQQQPAPRRSWGEGQNSSYDPWDIEDPNEDSIFFFPTGRTLRRQQLSLGFPGSAGIPDIEYGITDFLQIGAGYTLFGFTPSARLGLIRGRRVDFTLIGGAYLPAGSTHPFYGEYGGAALSAGREDFRVTLGYQWMQAWGSPFPDVNSVSGGLGTTGVEVKIAPRAKFLFMVENFTQLGTEQGTQPLYVFAVSPGVRVYSNHLSADIGFLAGEAYNVKLKRDELPSNKSFGLPMLTLRYQL